MCILSGTGVFDPDARQHSATCLPTDGSATAAYARFMVPPNAFRARFDEVATGGERRVIVGIELRDRESDGSVPTAAWFRGEEYRLDIEDEAGVAIYVRRL